MSTKEVWSVPDIHSRIFQQRVMRLSTSVSESRRFGFVNEGRESLRVIRVASYFGKSMSLGAFWFWTRNCSAKVNDAKAVMLVKDVGMRKFERFFIF